MENRNHIISLVTFNVTPGNCRTVSDELGVALRELQKYEGFLEGTLVENEQKTQLSVFTEWESRHSWAAAEWHEEIAHTLTHLVQGTGSYDIKMMYPLLKVSAAPR